MNQKSSSKEGFAIWLVKRKGADWFGNYGHNYEITIGEDTIYAQLCFYRRKDAVKYLKSMKYSQYFEVVKKVSPIK